MFACIEGEVALLTAGFLCQKGLMSLKLVILTAFLGTMFTEQCLYFVGRVYGSKLLEKYPKIAKKSEKVLEFLRKYNSAFIFGSRFVYGIRNISPMVIGIAGIPPLKFSTLNIPAAFIWAVLVACVGFFCAGVLDSAKEGMQYFEIGALVLLLFALGYFIYNKTLKKRKK